ncbi:1-acyl-sn-glycerol-3-phosphate acyltransferase [Myxococcota bacterium]|nr:1-acyl-sn-glycerol-3-phosphate acyltransferase [Myxococcota bacterium]
MLHRGLSTVFWIFFTISCVALYPVALVVWLVTLPFDPRLRVLHQFTCFWASLYTWFNPAWPIEIIGRDKIRPDATYVMVANHQSLLDILVLFRLFTHFKWVSKVENFRVPFIGWNMRMNRYIQIKRGKKESVVKMMRHCRDTLEAGSSIMMFPEGTRSATDQLARFKTGAFELALDTHRPILPILVIGTADALPKRGFVLRGRHEIRVTILEPIEYENFAGSSANELTLRVREQLNQALTNELLRTTPEPSPPS